MLSNILIALGFMGTGILVGLAIEAWVTMGDKKKLETKKIGDKTITFVYDD
jgi:hypothetical protein